MEKKKKKEYLLEALNLDFKSWKLDVKKVLTFTRRKVKNLTFNARSQGRLVLLWGMRNLILKA